MKRLFLIVIFIALQWSCTKTVEKIIYPDGDPNASTGAIVGLVTQKDSGAKVVVRQATPIDSTLINPTDGQFRIDSLQVGNYDVSIKAPNYGTYWIRNVVVNPGGVTYVGEIRLSNIPDLIASFYPEDQSEVVFDRRWSQISISVVFKEPMDRESVEQAFSTDPPSEGVFYWGMYSQIPTPRYFWDEKGFYDYGRSGEENQGATITTFSKVKAFTYRMARKDGYADTTYTVTISTAAMDTAGNHLEFPLRFRFSTVQSASTQNAILTKPENGDIYVDPLDNSSIYITFPRRMDQASVEKNLTISPQTDAIFVWPSGNELRIYTGGPLQCETLYQFHLPESALDLDGIPLGEPFDFSFETAPVQIESVTPRSGEIFVSRDTRISVRFNTYMILSSVQAAMTISPGISGRFIRGYENSNGRPKDVITFIPSNRFAPNTKYTVTVGTGAFDLHGMNLKEAYTFSFVTEPE